MLLEFELINQAKSSLTIQITLPCKDHTSACTLHRKIIKKEDCIPIMHFNWGLTKLSSCRFPVEFILRPTFNQRWRTEVKQRSSSGEVTVRGPNGNSTGLWDTCSLGNPPEAVLLYTCKTFLNSLFCGRILFNPGEPRPTYHNTKDLPKWLKQ